MYKIIKIGGNDYKFEYTLEASMYYDFVEKLTKYVVDFAGLTAKYDTKEINKDNVVDTSIQAISDMLVAQTTRVPELTKLGFHAGLLENQKLTTTESYELYKQYMREYNKKPLDVLNEILEKVNEDNFFELIGLDLTKMAKKEKKSNPRSKVIKKQ